MPLRKKKETEENKGTRKKPKIIGLER